jgi:hypothetical protein
MTFNTDIQKTEAEIKVLQKKLELLKEIETHKSQSPRMNLEDTVKGEVVSYNDEVYYRLEYPTNVVWYKRKYKCASTSNERMLVQITDGETHRLLEGLWFNDVKKGKYDDVVEEPYKNVKAYWDEKDNPKPVDEVVDRLIKKYQAQKLRNMLKVQLDYDGMVCDDIVDIVEDWILEEQSASGSQNVDTELLVEGFNDAIRKMKEMLR